MSLRETFAHLFAPPRAQQELSSEASALAEDLVRIAQGVYIPHLMAWLDVMSAQPVAVGAHHEMIAQAARAEAFRAVRQRIARDLKAAQARMEKK